MIKKYMAAMSVKGILVLSVAVLLAYFLLPDAVAQEAAVGVKIQPTLIEDAVEPGDTFRSVLKITNISDSEKLFYFVARDIEGLTLDGTPTFVEAGKEGEFAMSSWIIANVPAISVGAGETKEIPFTVNVPKNAEPGGHFAGLFVSHKPPQLTTTGVGIGYEIATILSLQVAGDITEDAMIRQFSTDKLIFTKAEVGFTTVVENKGNVLVRARGPLEITDVFGKKVATLVVNDPGGVVLPDSTREFRTVWTGEGLTIGRYQAALGLVYGNNGRKTITATTSFWVLPLNFILIVLVGIVGFIVIFFTIAHLYIRKKLVQLDRGTGRKETPFIHAGRSSKTMMFTLAAFIAVAILMVFLMVFLA